MTAAAKTITQLHPATAKWDSEVDAYMTHLRTARKSPHTMASYRGSLDAWRAFMVATGRSLDPRDAVRRDVQAFMAHVAETGSPSTQKTRYAALSTFFRWLASEDEAVIDRSPFTGVKAPRVPDVPVPVVSADHIERLLATTNGRSFVDRRDRAIILLMLSTGCRRGEIAGLLTDDLDHASSRVVFHGKGEKIREAAYGDATSEALRHYARARADHPRADAMASVGSRADTVRMGRPLWLPVAGRGHHGAFGAFGITDMLKRRCAEAGIPSIHPHQFRHTWADEMLAGGASEGDTMRLAGWSSRVMLNRYAAVNAHRRALTHYRDPVDRLLTRRR